ncbi:retrovirus-related pol polyprotein from transposon TNT 1-94 [Tanacetum coccineum]
MIDENSTLWNRRFGHANMRLIQLLASKELVRNLPKLKFDQHFCDAYKIRKQPHASHKAKNMVSTTRCLKLLHMDLFGPSAVRSYGGNRYPLVIVDNYSRVVRGFLLRRSLINNSASLSNKFGGFYFIFKFGISGLLHHVVTAIADRIRGSSTDTEIPRRSTKYQDMKSQTSSSALVALWMSLFCCTLYLLGTLPRDSNASSSSTTLNYSSSLHPLDDIVDENDEESFCSNSSSSSQNVSSSSNVVSRVRQNPPHKSQHLNTYLSETINLQTQHRDDHWKGLRSIGKALKDMMSGKRK